MNVRNMLDQLSLTLGEPTGAFYNINDRLRLLNQGHRQMVKDTQALRATDVTALVPLTATYPLPLDFLMLSGFKPKYRTLAGTYSKALVVADPEDMEDEEGWELTAPSEPTHLYFDGGDFVLWPTPRVPAEVTITYVKIPDELADDADVPFDGIPDLQEYAYGIVYYAAYQILMPRNPEYAMFVKGQYNESVRMMRHHLVRDPQRPVFIRPRYE